MRVLGFCFGLLCSMPTFAYYVTESVDCANAKVTPPGGIHNPPNWPSAANTETAERKPQPQPQNKTKPPSGEPKAELSPQEKLYKQRMIEISNEINNKIAEIQSKQNDIDTNVYFTQLPQLRGEKRQLEEQLQTLEMQRDQLQTQKTSKDFSKDLSNSK